MVERMHRFLKLSCDVINNTIESLYNVSGFITTQKF